MRARARGMGWCVVHATVFHYSNKFNIATRATLHDKTTFRAQLTAAALASSRRSAQPSRTSKTLVRTHVDQRTP